MKINNIKALRNYLYQNTGFTKRTVNNVIKSLGFPMRGSGGIFNDLSIKFENCAKHGAKGGFCGFILYSETVAFFMVNRKDIVSHMEQSAADMGIDIIAMIQGFGIFHNCDKPKPSEVGRALWDSKRNHELTELYNVFAWYALEEVSHIWYRYLEEHFI